MAALLMLLKIKAMGVALVVTPATAVVTANTPWTEPMFSMATTLPPPIGEAIVRTRTCWPLVTVPALVMNGPASMAYSPPTTVIDDGALMPLMVTTLEMVTADASAFKTGVKLNGSGVVSGAKRMLPVGRSTCVSMVAGKLLPGF